MRKTMEKNNDDICGTKSAKSFYSIYITPVRTYINFIYFFRYNYHINLKYDNCNDKCMVPIEKLEIVNVE